MQENKTKNSNIQRHIPLASIAVGEDHGLHQYLRTIHAIPMLTQEEEFMHAKRWSEYKDCKSVRQLVNSHLRLVAKIASGYRGYGLPMMDLISEGNIGLLQAVKRYDPDLGYRFSTYARWWIQAAIQEHILKSWSLVKIGTTAAQRKLFFSLNKIKNKLGMGNQKSLSDQDAQKIADELDVTSQEVIEMDGRLKTKGLSLNAKAPGEDNDSEWIDWMSDIEQEPLENSLIEKQDFEKGNVFLKKSFRNLTVREFMIFKARKLTEPPETLNHLSKKLSISIERVRQIENKAFKKVANSVIKQSQTDRTHKQQVMKKNA